MVAFQKLEYVFELPELSCHGNGFFFQLSLCLELLINATEGSSRLTQVLHKGGVGIFPRFFQAGPAFYIRYEGSPVNFAQNISFDPFSFGGRPRGVAGITFDSGNQRGDVIDLIG